MKNSLTFGFSVLALSTVLLSVSCTGKKKQNNSDKDVENVVVDSKENTMKIGYYHVDSLNEQYKLVKDVSTEIEGKINKMSVSFEAEVKKFEAWAKDMSDKMDKGLLLSKEEKDFMEKYQRRQMELAKKEQDLSTEIQKLQGDQFLKATNRVNDYVSRYAKENGFDMIFQYQLGGQIVYINESFDVTTSIISGLNAEYEQLQKDLK